MNFTVEVLKNFLFFVNGNGVKLINQLKKITSKKGIGIFRIRGILQLYVIRL